MGNLLRVALLALTACSSSCVPRSHRVHSLPGYGVPPVQHFSGLVPIASANASTADGGTASFSTKVHMHYWYVESARSPARDPLIVWFQGGPGASSLGGFFTEMGPLSLDDRSEHTAGFNASNGTLPSPLPNAHSWAAFSNMLFVEAPAGVGFSYSHVKADLTTGDNQTAADNYAALNAFFSKFASFQGNDFYVSGESYG